MTPLLRSRIEPRRSLDRWDALAAGLGLLVAAWVLAFKLRAYDALAYTDDMFQFEQLATSWLDGRWFRDGHYGFHLSIHTYFLVLPLAALVRPFGAAGLFLALAAAAGTTVFAVARLARRVGVPGPWAAGFGLVIGASPRALVNWHDPTYGFHLELLVPPLAVLLLERLLARHLLGSIALTLAILSAKEDMALLVGAVGLIALVELRLGDTAAIEPDGRRRYVSALVTIALAAAWLPVAFAILRAARAADPTAVDTYARVPLLHAAGVHSGGGVALYALTHAGDWLASPQVGYALAFVGLASLGLAALRPHLVPLALPATGIAWLMEDTVTWPPRFATILAIAWILAALGLGSAWRTRDRRWLPLLLVVCLALELRVLPWAREVYTLSPASPYTPVERAQADRVFERYAREAVPGEAVVAAPHLYRYANVRDLVWFNSLRTDARPVWLLWDDRFDDAAKYVNEPGAVLAREGRFSLRKR